MSWADVLADLLTYHGRISIGAFFFKCLDDLEIVKLLHRETPSLFFNCKMTRSVQVFIDKIWYQPERIQYWSILAVNCHHLQQ